MKIIQSSLIILALGAVLASCSNNSRQNKGAIGAFTLINKPIYVVSTSIKNEATLVSFDEPGPIHVVKSAPKRSVQATVQTPAIAQPIALTPPKQVQVKVAAAPRIMVSYKVPVRKTVIINRKLIPASKVLRNKRDYPVMPGRGR